MFNVLFEGIVVHTAGSVAECEQFITDCLRYQFPFATVTRLSERRWYVFSGCGVEFIIR